MKKKLFLKKNRGFIYGFILFVLYIFVDISPAISDIILIANKDIEVTSMNKKEIKDIFLGNKVSWRNGEKIVIIILENESINNNLMRKYFGKSIQQYKYYWKKQLFLGKIANLPKYTNSPKTLKTFVANTPGCISFLTTNHETFDDNVQIITISK